MLFLTDVESVVVLVLEICLSYLASALNSLVEEVEGPVEAEGAEGVGGAGGAGNTRDAEGAEGGGIEGVGITSRGGAIHLCQGAVEVFSTFKGHLFGVLSIGGVSHFSGLFCGFLILHISE